MQSGGGKGFQASINVTPLVDVVLVLLIIFMVVTPMMQESRAVELPEAEHVEGKDDEPERLSVVIDESGDIYIDNNPVEPRLVPDLVGARLARSPGLEVLVKGDRRLDYGTVRRVMRACREGGAKRVMLATRERSVAN